MSGRRGLYAVFCVLFHISSNNRNLALPLSKDSRIRINPQNLFSFLASHPLATNQIVEKGQTQLTMVQGLQRDISHDPETAGGLTPRKASCCSLSVHVQTHPHAHTHTLPYCPEINHRWNPHHIGKCKPVLHPGSGLFTVGVASDLASIHSDWLMLMPYLMAKYFYISLDSGDNEIQTGLLSLMDTQLLNNRASIRNQLYLTPQPHALSPSTLYTVPLLPNYLPQD